MSLRFGCNLGEKITDLIHFFIRFHLLFGDDWILMD